MKVQGFLILLACTSMALGMFVHPEKKELCKKEIVQGTLQKRCYSSSTPGTSSGKLILGKNIFPAVKYIGNLAVTKEGKQCQRWDSQWPHKHTNNNAAKFEDYALADAANYCRNPDDTACGEWCYTTDPKTRYQCCDISLKKGERYKDSRLGKEYLGDVAVTTSGKKCQRWDSQTPHKHERNNWYYFPDKNLKAAANYCRNPDNEPEGPWCYTTDPAKRWEYCNVLSRPPKVSTPSQPAEIE